MIALEALSKFASVFYTKSIDINISYFYNKIINNLTINENNRLLVQEIKLDDFKDNELNQFYFDIKGYGTVLIQLIVKYNLNQEKKTEEESEFEFSIFSSTSSYGSECNYSKLTVNTRFSLVFKYCNVLSITCS